MEGKLQLKAITGEDVASLPGLKRLSAADRDFLLAVLATITKPHRAPPWSAYLASSPAPGPVGACCFKALPSDGEVEIAYATLPSMERRGFAGMMVTELVGIASGSGVIDRIVAHTLPERNASTAVLERSGFECEGEVIDPEDGLVWRWSLAMPA